MTKLPAHQPARLSTWLARSVLLSALTAIVLLGGCRDKNRGPASPEFTAPDLVEAPLGATAVFSVSATDPSDGGANLQIEPVEPFPLLPTASFDAREGVMRYTPQVTEVGERPFVFAATTSEGVRAEVVVTVQVTARPAGSPTELTGVVLDSATQTPIVGAAVSVGTLQTTTGADGSFAIPGLTVDDEVVVIDGTVAGGSDPWTFVAEDLELVLGHMVFEGQVNIIQRPVYLPKLGPPAGIVDPGQVSMLTNPSLGIEVVVQPGSARIGTELFSGEMFIPEVAREFTPAALPDDLQPAQVIAVQPAGLTFDPPAAITFQNTEGLEPGTIVDIFSINPESGIFEDVGDAQVSSDGQLLETISGGVRFSSWHFPLPGEPGGSSGNDDQNGENDDPGGQCSAQGSRISVQSGNVAEEHELLTHQSLGKERGLKLVYNSTAANPCPTINTTTFIPANVALPQATRTTLKFGGVSQPAELFTESSRPSVRIARQIDATTFPTGWYPHEVEVTSLYPNSSRTRRVFGSTLVLNEIGSPFGSGWSLAGLARVRTVTGWPFVVLTEGDGGIKTFTPVTEGGPQIQTELCFTVDGSCSMNGSPWQLQRSGMEAAVLDSTLVPRDSSVAVAVVQFHSSGQGRATLEVPLTVIDSEATAQAVAAQIAAIPHRNQSCGNPMGVGINQAVEALSNNRTNRQIICICSDGDPGNDALAIAAADNAIGIGVDSVDILAIGPGANLARLQPIVRNGSLTVVPTFQEFAAAVSNKLRRVINGAPAGEFSCLMVNPDGSYTREFLSGEKQEFDSRGLLSAHVDRNGCITAYFYDADERLVVMRDPAGLETQLEYGRSGLLSRVIHPGGGSTSFAYAGTDLVSIRDPDGTNRTFSYDNAHRLTGQADKRGNLKSYEYDAVTGRIASATDASGETMLLAPSQTAGLIDPGLSSRAAPATARSEAEVMSLLTSRRGNASKIRTDRFGRVNRYEDPLGNTSEFERNANGLVTEARSPRGRIDTMQYDANGNLVAMTEAEGVSSIRRTTTYQYDPAHDWITRMTDGEGHSTAFEYDSAGNLTKITNPDNTERGFTYDSRGLVLTSTDENGNETTFTYDVAGRIETMTNALGQVTRYNRDGRGNVLSIVEGQGTPEQRTRSFTYDAMNRVLTATDGAGGTTSFTYDADGNLLTTELPTGEFIVRIYDSNGRLQSLSDPIRGTKTFAYDADGNLQSRTDARGLTTSFTYDESSRLLTATDPASGVETYGYDESGNVTSFTNARQKTTTFQFDLLERRVRMASPEGRFRQWGYDRTDNLTRETPPGTGSIIHGYDNRGRRLATSVPSVGGVAGNSITFTYDAVGNLRTVIDNDTRLERTYDELNRVREEKTLSGGLQPVTTLTSSYNAVGDRTMLVDSAGGTHTYGHDGAGRLTSVTATQVGNIGLAYDSSGRLRTVSYPNGVTGTYSYLGSGRLSQITHAPSSGPALVSLGYQTGPSGNIDGINDAGFQKSYGYDPLDRLTTATEIAPSAYAYDPVGNRSQSDSTTSAVYNDDNQLLSDDTGTYGYDPRGNLSQYDEAGAPPPQNYRWDAQSQLVEATGVSSYRYDGLGRRVEKVTPSGTRRYVYDGDNILLEFDGGGAIVARYTHGEQVDQHLAMVRGGAAFYYHADHLGSVRSVTDGSGAEANRYRYDPYGRVVERVEAVENPYWFTGREEAREVGLYYYRARWYEARSGRFVSEDPWLTDASDWNFYAYVKNTPMLHRDPFGLDIWIEGTSVSEGVPLHQSICVGQVGRAKCYSFGAKLPCFWCGEVYEDRQPGGRMERYKKTTPKEDEEFKQRLDKEIGREATYGPEICRTFSQDWFDRAPGTEVRPPAHIYPTPSWDLGVSSSRGSSTTGTGVSR